MSNTRQVYDAFDEITGKSVYLRGHAQATFMSDGRTVESAIMQMGGGGSSVYPQVEHGTNDTTLEIAPNTLHIWGEVEELSISLGDRIEGVVNEYLFQFSTGAVATALTLPEGLMWADGTSLALSPNATYKVSIINNLTTVTEFNPYIINEITFTYDENNGFYWKSMYPIATTLYLTYDNGMQTVMIAGESDGYIYAPSSPSTYRYFFSFDEDGSDFGDDWEGESYNEINDGVYLYKGPEYLTVPVGY